jgi:hypothetical protein
MLIHAGENKFSREKMFKLRMEAGKDQVTYILISKPLFAAISDRFDLPK